MQPGRQGRPACWLAACTPRDWLRGKCLSRISANSGSVVQYTDWNDKLIKEAQVVWIKYTRSRAERYTHDT
jgi:hypothetical protein